jgi:hypothetical protein
LGAGWTNIDRQPASAWDLLDKMHPTLQWSLCSGCSSPLGGELSVVYNHLSGLCLEAAYEAALSDKCLYDFKKEKKKVAKPPTIWPATPYSIYIYIYIYIIVLNIKLLVLNFYMFLYIYFFIMSDANVII